MKNIRACTTEESLTAYCNGGAQLYNRIASLNMFPIKVHFKQDLLANIVSMKSVSEIKGACVIMDTAHGMNIIVALTDGSIFKFEQYKNGLYYFDLTPSSK